MEDHLTEFEEKEFTYKITRIYILAHAVIILFALDLMYYLFL